MTETFVHPSAAVEPGVRLGRGTRIWHGAHLRSGASLGDECIVGEGVFVDAGVRIGNRCKIQNGAQLYKECVLEDGVFVGPGAILANDRHPRAINPDGSLKALTDWQPGFTAIEEGASIGAGAVILPGVRVARWSIIGALSLVTRDVPPHSLMVGIPGRIIGNVCFCGCRRTEACEVCGWEVSG